MTPPITVHNEIAIAASADRIWDVLADVAKWPTWYRACRWVRVTSTNLESQPVTFRWKAHPLVLSSHVVAIDRPHLFAIDAEFPGLHADRTFTLRPSADGRRTIVVSHETQVGWLPWLGRAIIQPRLHAANEVMFADLAKAVTQRAGAGSARAKERPAPDQPTVTT